MKKLNYHIHRKLLLSLTKISVIFVPVLYWICQLIPWLVKPPLNL